MKRKFLTGGLMLSIAAGALLLIGTVGASDLDMIDLKDLIKQISVAFYLMVTGSLGLKLGGWDYVD